MSVLHGSLGGFPGILRGLPEARAIPWEISWGSPRGIPRSAGVQDSLRDPWEKDPWAYLPFGFQNKIHHNWGLGGGGELPGQTAGGDRSTLRRPGGFMLKTQD